MTVHRAPPLARRPHGRPFLDPVGVSSGSEMNGVGNLGLNFHFLALGPRQAVPAECQHTPPQKMHQRCTTSTPWRVRAGIPVTRCAAGDIALVERNQHGMFLSRKLVQRISGASTNGGASRTHIISHCCLAKSSRAPPLDCCWGCWRGIRSDLNVGYQEDSSPPRRRLQWRRFVCARTHARLG